MDAFLGEIRPFAIPFAPTGWELCNGQIIPIGWNVELFTLIGNRYGGDGVNNFALPDIKGTVLLGSGAMPGGSTYQVGDQGGSLDVPLQATQIPAHTHTVTAMVIIDPANENAPAENGSRAPNANSFLSDIYCVPPATLKRKGKFYTQTNPDDQMHPDAVTTTGMTNPHNNMQPFLVINYCICTNGYYPARP